MIPGLRHSQPDELPDVFLDGMPLTIETAQAYFRLKHIALWLTQLERKRRVQLHVWETWDQLEMRLDARFPLPLWHPAHWEKEAM